MRTTLFAIALLAAAPAWAQVHVGPYTALPSPEHASPTAPPAESWEWHPEYANGLQNLLKNTKNGILVQLVPRYFESGYAVGLDDGARVAAAADAFAGTTSLINTAGALHAALGASGAVDLEDARALMPPALEAQFFAEKYKAAYGWAAKDAAELGSEPLKQTVLAAFTQGYLAGARHVLQTPTLLADLSAHARTLCLRLLQTTRYRSALSPEQLDGLRSSCDRRAEDALRWSLELHPLGAP